MTINILLTKEGNHLIAFPLIDNLERYQISKIYCACSQVQDSHLQESHLQDSHLQESHLQESHLQTHSVESHFVASSLHEVQLPHENINARATTVKRENNFFILFL